MRRDQDVLTPRLLPRRARQALLTEHIIFSVGLLDGRHEMKTRTLTSVICVSAALAAGACGTTPELSGPTAVQRPGIVAPPSIAPDQTSCTATNADWAIGSTANTELLEKARLAAKAAVARLVRRGEPITAEYLGTRLTLETDEQLIVLSVRCG
jgi:hypothetical protein